MMLRITHQSRNRRRKRAPRLHIVVKTKASKARLSGSYRGRKRTLKLSAKANMSAGSVAKALQTGRALFTLMKSRRVRALAVRAISGA